VKKNIWEQITLLGLICLWLIICLFPLWNLVAVTFSSDSSNLTSTFLPNSFSNGIAKITYALTTVRILTASVHTLLYTCLTIAGMLFVCSLTAYEFTFFDFPLKKLFFSATLASTMLPMVLYVIPLYRFVTNIGLADTIMGVALPLMVSALSIFILMQFLEDLPVSFIESARIDGAGHFSIFFYIVFPLMRNGLLTTTVLMFLSVWGSYLWPSLVTGGNIQPMSVSIANMLSPMFYTDPRVKIAALLLSAAPPLTIYIFFQRYVISGISMSGIKG
jgi:multiple sugar transport system permease protein